MKKYNLIIKIFAFLMFFTACNEDILDKTPLDRYSSATVWSDIDLADAVLQSAYRNLKSGGPYGYSILLIDMVSDALGRSGTDVYLQGNVTADNLGVFSSRYKNLNWTLFSNIQIVNTFLENIEKVPDAYPEIQRADIKAKADIMKGEALFLRAYCYAQMARLYGGLPIMKESWAVGDDYYIERGTFEETINFIVEDCDAAAALLKSKDEMEQGRATNGLALALKSRILLFAASDLTADGTGESKYVSYESPDRTALWTAARDAAKAVMDLNVYELNDFGAPDKDAVAKNYFSLFKQKTLDNKEIIWGKLFLDGMGDQSRWNVYNGPNGLNGWGVCNPTQAMIDAYQMEDGSAFFDHFEVDADGYYKNKGNTDFKNASPYHNREPRFYGSVLCDSAVWQKRTDEGLAERDPLGIYDRRTRRIVEGGVETSKTYGIDTRNGPVGDWNGGYSGYLIKKTMDDELLTPNEDVVNTNIWIEFRYAEIIMNYAEACMELGGSNTAIATTYINMIRNRVGLPDFTGDIETALRHERQIEFAYEGLRWYDIRRWKIMETVLTNAKGIDIIETTDKDAGTVTTTWKQINVHNRNPVKKMYWIPIPGDELKKAPQLVQNPGY